MGIGTDKPADVTFLSANNQMNSEVRAHKTNNAGPSTWRTRSSIQSCFAVNYAWTPLPITEICYSTVGNNRTIAMTWQTPYSLDVSMQSPTSTSTIQKIIKPLIRDLESPCFLEYSGEGSWPFPPTYSLPGPQFGVNGPSPLNPRSPLEDPSTISVP